jgi:hypothetical protein
MENFENIESLVAKIKKDKNTKNVTEKRFPVRYIFLSSFDTLKELVSETKKIGIDTFELSQLLPKNDGWITKQEFIEKIKSLDDKKDYLLLPFSEVARFYEKQDFNNLFSQLTELENIGNTNQRIYIPLLGIKDRFNKEFYQNFNRKIEYSFIWEIYEPIKRAKIFLYNNRTLTIDKIQKVSGVKEWLTLWKKDLSSPTLTLSKTLYFLSDNAKPDEIFEFLKVSNYKELVYNVFEIDILIEYKDSEKDFWQKLVKQLDKKKFSSFLALVKSITNVTKINVNNFIELWLSPNREDFDKWLLKNQLLRHDCIKEFYLCKVLSHLDSFDDDSELLKRLWFDIFTINNPSDEIFKNRIKLLKQFYSIKKLPLPQDTENNYKQKLEALKDRKTKLKYITGLLEFEKELIIKDFAEHSEKSILDRYSELKEYLDDPDFDNLRPEHRWIYEYIKLYKQAKIKNEYTKEIAAAINKINENEETFYRWYYGFEEVKKFLNENTFDYIFWVDALSIEWVNLVEMLLKNKNYNIERKQIARVNLPSTTDKNKYDYDNLQYIQDFDKFIHDNIYNYPTTIVKEVEELRKIFEKIVIEKNKKAVIIFDHGLSALVRLNNSSKNFPKAKHEGRYLKIDNPDDYSKDDNYIVKDNYIIASKHVSLSTKPVREVHGGCTPEEVLVPIIVFNSKDNNYQKTESYTINLITKEIDIKKPTIKLTVLPLPNKKVYAYIEKGERIELIKQDNDEYFNRIPVKKSGKHKLIIKIGNFEEEFKIIIKSGFKEEDLF